MRSLAFGSTLTGTRETDTRARTAFRQVASVLFNDIAATPDPDLTLHGVTLIGGAQRFPGIVLRAGAGPALPPLPRRDVRCESALRPGPG